jgi:pimeloyl-ACP methyl ester carboxylesterase
MFAAGVGSTHHLLLLDPVFDIPDSDFEAVLADQLLEIDANAGAEDYEADHPDWHPEDRFHKAVGARATSPFVIEQCLRDNAPYHHLGLLEELVVPTRILRADPTVGTMSLVKSFDRITNPVVTHIQIDGAGHSIQRDRPDLVIEHALDLLGVDSS